MPYVAGWMGFETMGPAWLLTAVFFPLGLIGFYASKFGNDRFVERLLIVSGLDREI